MTTSELHLKSLHLDFKIRIKPTHKILIIIAATLFLVGCGTISTSEQPAKKELFQVNENQSIGQTFLSRYDGLNGISILINPINSRDVEMHLELYEDIDDSQPIRTSNIHVSANGRTTSSLFYFPPIKYSAKEDYYIRITNEGPGSATVAGGAGNSYLNGSLYVMDLAQNSQMAFNLEYSPSLLAIGLVKEGLLWLIILLIGLFLIGIPGWAVLSWTFPLWGSMNWIMKFALSLGVGVAIYPVIILWADILSIELGSWFAWLLPIICSGVIMLRRFRPYQGRNKLDSNDISESQTSNIQVKALPKWEKLRHNALKTLPDLGFLVAVLLIILTRFWPIRSLDAAMWGDSYQHTLITQLIVENGGLFKSWLPYTDLSSFTYHFGFHSIAAVYHWMTDLNPMQDVLWIGQLLNIFAIITLYPMAVLIGKNRWAGVIAIVIAGLLSPMPLGYTNWGRFTQLAGQVILPTGIFIIWVSFNTKRLNWKLVSLTWIILAGLSLSHYRVILFIPLFYIAYLVFSFRVVGLVNFLKNALTHAIGAILLTLPWLFRLFDGRLPEIYGNQVQVPADQISQAVQDYNVIGNIAVFLPYYLWILLAMAILWGIIRRSRESIIFSFWWILILLAANPGWLRLPGTGIMSNFAVFIAAYIPAGILIGSAAGSILYNFGIKGKSDNWWYVPDETVLGNSRRFAIFSGFAILFIFVISLIGFRKELSLVKPSVHSLVTRPDVRAGQWIDKNLPEDSRFVVNSFFAYGGSLVVGSDAGWWLPLLANRQTTLPPLNYGMESSDHPDYLQETNNLVAEIQEKGINHPESIAELFNRDITHVFIGQQRGKVNTKEPPILIPKQLQNDPNFKLVYAQDRVVIFELLKPEG